jgi:hypothetical protein
LPRIILFDFAKLRQRLLAVKVETAKRGGELYFNLARQQTPDVKCSENVVRAVVVGWFGRRHFTLCIYLHAGAGRKLRLLQKAKADTSEFKLWQYSNRRSQHHLAPAGL